KKTPGGPPPPPAETADPPGPRQTPVPVPVPALAVRVSCGKGTGSPNCTRGLPVPLPMSRCQMTPGIVVRSGCSARPCRRNNVSCIYHCSCGTNITYLEVATQIVVTE